MMAPADHAGALLDAQSMGELLRRELPGLEALQLHGCAIHHSRRRISRRIEEQGAAYLGVVYELALREPASGARLDHWLYAKAYVRAGAAVDTDAAGPGAPARLRALDSLVWTLPADPAMPQLAQFLDAQHVCGEVRTLLGEQAGEPATAARARIVRYEPESHCTARFVLPLAGGARTVYGKTYADAGWAEAARRLGVLWARGERDARAFALARPLGTSAALRCFWQDEARGVPLRDGLGGPHAARWLQRLAQALARLQAGPAMGDAPLGAAALLERTRKQRKKLVCADVRLAPALDAVLDRLSVLPAPGRPVVVHGDFHVDQMLCGDARISLFDYDNFALGSAAHDIADFASQLLTDTAFAPAQRFALARDFIDFCLAQLPAAPGWCELDWYLRLLLLRKAYSFFVRYRDGWQARVREAAALAARGLAPLRPQEKRT